jgi:hypothetical protein
VLARKARERAQQDPVVDDGAAGAANVANVATANVATADGAAEPPRNCILSTVFKKTQRRRIRST